MSSILVVQMHATCFYSERSRVQPPSKNLTSRGEEEDKEFSFSDLRDRTRARELVSGESTKLQAI